MKKIIKRGINYFKTLPFHINSMLFFGIVFISLDILISILLSILDQESTVWISGYFFLGFGIFNFFLLYLIFLGEKNNEIYNIPKNTKRDFIYFVKTIINNNKSISLTAILWATTGIFLLIMRGIAIMLRYYDWDGTYALTACGLFWIITAGILIWYEKRNELIKGGSYEKND